MDLKEDSASSNSRSYSLNDAKSLSATSNKEQMLLVTQTQSTQKHSGKTETLPASLQLAMDQSNRKTEANFDYEQSKYNLRMVG